MSRQLIDEWTSLPQEKKDEAFSIIASRFVERVPPEFLASMAEQFAAAADGESGTSNAEAVGFEDKEEPVEGGVAEDGEEGAMETGNFSEAMRQLLQDVEQQPAEEWPAVWSGVVFLPEDELDALTALFEAALQGGVGLDLAPRVVMELTRAKQVEMTNVEAALQATASKLEALVQVNENAWNLHSHMLMLLFPKTPSTTWGFLRPGWSWISWWQMTERVLVKADHFRAFDILVLVLQMMQEKSGAVIKQQQVWKEAGRMAKVQKALCGYGEMDGVSILETLAAYGVEL